MPHNDRPITPLEKRVYETLPAAQLAMRAGIYWGRETFALGFIDKRFAKLPEGMRAQAHRQAGAATPSCAASSRRATRSAASAC